MKMGKDIVTWLGIGFYFIMLMIKICSIDERLAKMEKNETNESKD